MTNGASSGTSGRRFLPSWALAYIILAVVMIVINSVNVLSFLDERSWQNRPIDWWKPAVWEGSSAMVFLAIAWVPMLAIRRFPLHGGSWPRNLAIHAAITIPFSLVHVGLMVALRHGAYALAGQSYDFGGADALLYEYRKDVITYALFTATFWLTARLMHGGSTQPVQPAPESIVIDEGQRLIRVPPGEVLAARSCGNYVEFLLVDGRRPLMRTTLAGLEAALGPMGFVRTHRSWLVNPTHVVEIEAEGSGDHGLKLADGTPAPLSRRYRQALERLRASA